MTAADITYPFPSFASRQVITGYGSGAGKFYSLPDGTKNLMSFWKHLLFFFHAATIESKDLIDGSEVYKMYLGI